MSKPVVLRHLAERDIEEAAAHYGDEGGVELAWRFIDALEEALGHVARHPATGSPRYSNELDLPGLRFWSLKRFPFLIFYVDGEHHRDVWRVLHGQRDIPAWLDDGEPRRP